MMRVAVIPALQPDKRLVSYTRSLLARSFARVVVVDDGSGPDYAAIFETVAALPGATVLRHAVNRGKGAALKTAFAQLRETLDQPAVIVTADCDGQHAEADVENVAHCLEERLPARALVLGTRDFGKDNVPFKSRAGNRITSVCFRLACRVRLPDTQTGLRAFSTELLPEMLDIEGERYEYEMRMLAYAAKHRIDLVQCPIETVYENNNAGSHFHPWRDSARVYRALFGPVVKYALASLAGTAVDFAAFYLLSALIFRGGARGEIFAATALARVLSASVNYLLNRHFVFARHARGAALRYAVLAVCTFLLSSEGVFQGFRQLDGALGAAVGSGALKTLIKAVVDTLLFIINYQLCRRWVFPARKKMDDKN